MTPTEHAERFAAIQERMLAPIVDRCFKLVIRHHVLRNKSHRVKVQVKRCMRSLDKALQPLECDIVRESTLALNDAIVYGSGCVRVDSDGLPHHVPFREIPELPGASPGTGGGVERAGR